MKMIGKRSVASVLKTLLDGLLFLTCFMYVLAIFFLLAAATSGNTAPHGEFVNLGIPYILEQSEPGPEIQPLAATLGGMALGMEISRELALNLTKWWFLILILVFITLILALFVYIVFQLRRFLASLVEGSPFTLENARRIRIIGIIIIAGELGMNLLMIVTAVIINASSEIEGAKLAWAKMISGFNLSTIFLGFVVLIIAEIFRLGVRMREDQELTI